MLSTVHIFFAFLVFFLKALLFRACSRIFTITITSAVAVLKRSVTMTHNYVDYGIRSKTLVMGQGWTIFDGLCIKKRAYNNR